MTLYLITIRVWEDLHTVLLPVSGLCLSYFFLKDVTWSFGGFSYLNADFV